MVPESVQGQTAAAGQLLEAEPLHEIGKLGQGPRLKGQHLRADCLLLLGRQRRPGTAEHSQLLGVFDRCLPFRRRAQLCVVVAADRDVRGMRFRDQLVTGAGCHSTTIGQLDPRVRNGDVEETYL